MSLLFEIRWILYKVSPHQPSKVDETNPVAWSLWSFVVSICFSAKHLETSHMKHNWATLFWGFGVDIKHLWLDPRMKLAKAKDVATYHWNNKFYWSSFAGFLSKTTTQTERMLINKTKMNTHVMIYIYIFKYRYIYFKQTHVLVGACHSRGSYFLKTSTMILLLVCFLDAWLGKLDAWEFHLIMSRRWFLAPARGHCF